MKVFVAALDWGLGHATRIVPVIKDLVSKGHDIIIGCSERQKKIYQEHYPELTYENIISVSPVFSTRTFQIWPYVKFVPKFLFAIWQENRQLHKLYKKYHFNVVISDNRYGLFLPQCKNILVTHQLHLKLPAGLHFLTWGVNKIIHFWINRFDYCLIPDYPSSVRIAGVLSEIFNSCKPIVRYIGPLSRLSLSYRDDKLSNDVLVLISGPEQQRTVFEQIITNQLVELTGYTYAVVRGLPLTDWEETEQFKNHVSPQRLKALIKHSRFIICRSGYSTIMDLVSLNKTAFLVPTPGQSEQEYLADYLAKQGWFLSGSQNNFNLINVIERLNGFVPNPSLQDGKSIESFSI
jgi:uncharacterized protein (TIGR00661 family)